MGPLEILVRGHLMANGVARTRGLATRCGLSTAAMREAMKRLERRGVVRRDPRRSAVNDICWVLADASRTDVTASEGEVSPGTNS